MESVIVIVHVIAAIGITGLVLLQQGKGADMGASFGAGASQTIFGSSGSGNVLTKSTTWLAIVFFATSLGLAMIARQQSGQAIQDDGLIQNLDQLESQRSQAGDLPQAPATSGEGDLPLAPQAAADDSLEDGAAAPVEAPVEESTVIEEGTVIEEAPAEAGAEAAEGGAGESTDETAAGEGR